MKAKKTEQIIKTTRRLDVRQVFRQEMFGFKNLKKTLSENNVNIEDKDLTILYNPDKNILYFSQEATMEVEKKYEVTPEMKAQGIQGDYVVSKYTETDNFITNIIKNPSNELLETLTFRRLPRVKIEAREKNPNYREKRKDEILKKKQEALEKARSAKKLKQQDRILAAS